jgi:hypothetical protein
MLKRQIASRPHHLVPQLTRWVAEEGLERVRMRIQDYAYFEENGWYSHEALNHWLYHNTTQP